MKESERGIKNKLHSKTFKEELALHPCIWFELSAMLRTLASYDFQQESLMVLPLFGEH